MKVAIVAGPPCSGKSTFIQKTFPDRTVIDLFAFQPTGTGNYEAVMQSYIECRDALVKALEAGNDVVLEHTLLKAKRRPMYIDAIRSVTDADIEMYWMKPSLETYCKRLQERKCFFDEGDAQYMLEFGEEPTCDEGYSKVEIITDATERESDLDEQAR